ncbi:MAG: DUF1592 domain-containing protein [Planctomycetota bacterium]
MPRRHVELFRQHCFDCHDSASEEAGVNLESLPLEVSRDVGTAALWAKVLNAINSGEMPPEDYDPIPDELKLSFLEDLTSRMVRARMILSDTGGKAPLRRLNRREYASTIEALVGVRPDVSSLPDDQVGDGFDTHGASLFMSSHQIEQYLQAARDALRRASRAAGLDSSFQHGSNRQPEIVHVEPEETYTPHYRDYLAKLRSEYDNAVAFKSQTEKTAAEFGLIDPHQADVHINHFESWSRQLDDYLHWPESKTGVPLILTIKGGGMTKVELPKLTENQPGRYRIRVRAGRYDEAPARFHYLELSSMVDREREFIGWRKVTHSIDDPEIVEFEYVHVPGVIANLQIHQRTHQDRGDKALWTRAMKSNGVGAPPGVWIDWAELIGPEPVAAVPEGGLRWMPQQPNEESDLESIRPLIESFTLRAFRGKRPSESYVERLLEQFRYHQDAGATREDALVETLAIVLASPEFLYMVNDGRDDDASRLSDIEFAVRLSYLLWGEPPDDELMEVARENRLTNPSVLQQETSRMIADARSNRFVRGFTQQWLELERIFMFQFNGLMFPTFDNAVRESAREEVFQMVRTVLREDEPIGRLLDADYVVINDLLADYYGIPDVLGHHYRRVSVPSDSPRGGLLGTAAVACMGSDGLRSSPVERGAWVLRHLLNEPPAPAPPNVPQLSRLGDEPRSARTIQRMHQEQPQCAQCHRKIDPVGFGLENFGADGLWRQREVIELGKLREASRSPAVEFEIDPSGQLPSGESFADFYALRQLIASKQESFTRGFVEELISYGLGRPYSFSDESLADQLMRVADRADYRMDAIIHAFVQSDAFGAM